MVGTGQSSVMLCSGLKFVVCNYVLFLLVIVLSVNNGAGTAYPYGPPDFSLGFLWGSFRFISQLIRHSNPWSLRCYVCGNFNPVLSSFVTYHRVCNTRDAVSSWVHPCFFVVFVLPCVVFCGPLFVYFISAIVLSALLRYVVLLVPLVLKVNEARFPPAFTWINNTKLVWNTLSGSIIKQTPSIYDRQPLYFKITVQLLDVPWRLLRDWTFQRCQTTKCLFDCFQLIL